MSSEQQYRPLKAGEIISNGDQYLDVCGNWIGYAARRYGQEFTGIDTARRLVVVDQQVEYRSIEAGEIIQDGDQFLYDGEWVTYQQHRWGSPFNCVTQVNRRPIVKNGQGEQAGEEPEQPADESSSTLAARLQEALDDAICCNMNLQTERDRLQAELAASQRMYMQAMSSLEREVNRHRETNRRLDEVCGERDVLQEQLNERASEPRKADILEFLSFQVAAIPYLQSAVGKDAQRELTLVGRTLQMVGKAIEIDRIGRDGEGKEVNSGKE
jgi:hypothetical protein